MTHEQLIEWMQGNKKCRLTVIAIAPYGGIALASNFPNHLMEDDIAYAARAIKTPDAIMQPGDLGYAN